MWTFSARCSEPLKGHKKRRVKDVGVADNALAVTDARISRSTMQFVLKMSCSRLGFSCSCSRLGTDYFQIFETPRPPMHSLLNTSDTNIAFILSVSENTMFLYYQYQDKP